MLNDCMVQSANSNPTIAKLHVFAITLTVIVVGIAIYLWASLQNFDLLHLTKFQLFPLFGLLAFSIMWAQYMVEAVKNYLGYEGELSAYFRTTSKMVLAFILLHPTLLIIQLYQNGDGLPPGSYTAYVGPGMTWLVGLGTFALFMFIAFEFRKFFEARNLWKYVVILNDVAIIAIFYHGLRLGSTINATWFKTLWLFYGMTLVVALCYKYYRQVHTNQVTGHSA